MIRDWSESISIKPEVLLDNEHSGYCMLQYMCIFGSITVYMLTYMQHYENI